MADLSSWPSTAAAPKLLPWPWLTPHWPHKTMGHDDQNISKRMTWRRTWRDLNGFMMIYVWNYVKLQFGGKRAGPNLPKWKDLNECPKDQSEPAILFFHWTRGSLASQLVCGLTKLPGFPS